MEILFVILLLGNIANILLYFKLRNRITETANSTLKCFEQVNGFMDQFIKSKKMDMEVHNEILKKIYKLESDKCSKNC